MKSAHARAFIALSFSRMHQLKFFYAITDLHNRSLHVILDDLIIKATPKFSRVVDIEFSSDLDSLAM